MARPLARLAASVSDTSVTAAAGVPAAGAGGRGHLGLVLGRHAGAADDRLRQHVIVHQVDRREDDGDVEAVEPPSRQRVVEFADAVRVVVEQLVARGFHRSLLVAGAVVSDAASDVVVPSSGRCAAAATWRAIETQRPDQHHREHGDEEQQRDDGEDLDAGDGAQGVHVHQRWPPVAGPAADAVDVGAAGAAALMSVPRRCR